MSEKGEYGGRVQRVVDGEAHEFQNWEALVETLRAMLAATSRGPAAPPPAAGALDTIQPGPHEGLDTKGESN